MEMMPSELNEYARSNQKIHPDMFWFTYLVIHQTSLVIHGNKQSVRELTGNGDNMTLQWSVSGSTADVFCVCPGVCLGLGGGANICCEDELLLDLNVGVAPLWLAAAADLGDLRGLCCTGWPTITLIRAGLHFPHVSNINIEIHKHGS